MSPPDAERGAAQPLVQSNRHQARRLPESTAPACTCALTGQEWRISWRRIGWSVTTATKSRVFQRRHDANAFHRRLISDDRPDLSRAVVTVDRRDVGAWDRIR